MSKPDVKKLILLNLPYVFAFYFADKIAAVFRLAPGTAFIDRLTNGFAVFGTAFANPLPSFHPVDLLIGVLAGALLKLAVYVKGKNRKKFRQGEEYGSARWGKPEDIKPYMDPEFSNNVILTQTEFLTMNSRPKQPKYARNKNILVIGGSGSGKTRFFVKPNLMQMHSSYVVTDPKGTVLVECGKMLEKGGYVIKSLNTINFRKSMHYNPFSYIRSEKDILKLVNTIIVNTKGDGDKSGEDFWVKAEKLYYIALIGYIWYEAPDHEKNFTTLLEMINASEAREDDETFKNPVDVMFDELEARDPDHFAVKQYRKYKLAAGKTAKSILISCGARLAPFDIAELRELMSYDEMELDTIGDRKTALFVIISDTDDTFNFVVAIMYSATKQMTFTTDGFPSMCAVCWMSLRTSVKSRSLISSSPPSEAGKSRRQSSCSPSLSSRPSTRMRRTPSRATVTAPFSSAEKKNRPSRKSARCWARRQSTFTTPQKPVPTTTPTA